MEKFLLGGSYIGNLAIGSSVSETSETLTAFFVKISLTSDIIEIQEVENIDSDYPIVFTENMDGNISIIAKPADGWVSINEEIQTLDGNTGLFMAGMNALDGQLQLSNTITGNSPMRLLDAAYSSDGVHSAVAFFTSGTVMMDGFQIISQPNGNSFGHS